MNEPRAWFIPTADVLGHHEDGTPVVLTETGVADGTEVNLAPGAYEYLMNLPRD